MRFRFEHYCAIALCALLAMPAAQAVTYNCKCDPGYSPNSDQTGIYCTNGNAVENKPCHYYTNPGATSDLEKCICTDSTWTPSYVMSGVKCVSDNGAVTSCIPPTDPAQPSSSASATGTATSTAAQVFNSAVATTIDTSLIAKVGADANGEQTDSLQSAALAAQLGGSQAATIGAINCAQGANANLTSAADAAAFYAICRQNFDTAKGLTGPASGYNPDRGIVDGAAAQQSLEDFEKNFGVSKEDYLKRMLGEGGGPGSLSGLVEGKIPEAKFAEAMDAASKLAPSELTQDPNKFAVDLGSGPKKAPATAKLRDELKKKLSGKMEGRKAASASQDFQAEKPQKIGDKEHLEPLDTNSVFGSMGETRELSIFDVVHQRYTKLTGRMHR